MALTSQETFFVGFLWAICISGITAISANNYNRNTSDPLCKAAANSHLTLTTTTKTPETKPPTFHSDFASLKWIYKVLPKLPWVFVQSLVERLSVQLSSGILASSSLLSLPKYLDTK